MKHVKRIAMIPARTLKIFVGIPKPVYTPKDGVKEPEVLTDDQKEDLLFLKALRFAGVDNWQGYDDAITLYDEMTEEEGLNV